MLYSSKGNSFTTLLDQIKFVYIPILLSHLSLGMSMYHADKFFGLAISSLKSRMLNWYVRRVWKQMACQFLDKTRFEEKYYLI